MHSFQGASDAEGPARAAGTLIFDVVHSTFLRPVKLVIYVSSEWELRERQTQLLLIRLVPQDSLVLIVSPVRELIDANSRCLKSCLHFLQSDQIRLELIEPESHLLTRFIVPGIVYDEV